MFAKDKDLRGELLGLFYKHRRLNREVDVRDELSPELLADYFRIGRALSDQGLIEWTASLDDTIGHGRISAEGVDVIEGNRVAPIAISIDHSIQISGSRNVQVGNGNTMSTNEPIGKLIAAVDHSHAGEAEKSEAKGLIQKISENKLIVAALSGLITIIGGTEAR